MGLHPTIRSIGLTVASCQDCDWTWAPRKGTETTGEKGYRNGVMAARSHGEHMGHEVTVTRTTHYPSGAS